MGLNGSGKSTFSKSAGRAPRLRGHRRRNPLQKGQDILELEPHERATSGIFLAFQYPLEIPGVSNRDFLRVAYNAHRKAQGEEEMDVFDFDDLIEEKLDVVKMDASFLDRSVNEGFSGGEKKAQRNSANGPAGAAALHSGRNRLRPGHRRPEDRC